MVENTRLHPLAAIISELSIPPLMAAVVFPMLCFYFEANFWRAAFTTLVCWISASVVPIGYIYYLERAKKVSHRHIPIKEQRTTPYLVGTTSYLFGLILLLALDAPFAVWGLMLCYITNTLIITAINLSWKISAHAMGVAGALTGAVYAFGNKVLPFYLLLVIVCWARFQLRAHTFLQLLAGAFLGIILTFSQLTLIENLLF